VPSARFGQAMVYVSATDKIIMFGGATGEQNPLNETWMYDRGKNTWTDLKPSGNLPPARRSMAVAYHPGDNKIVIFGGLGADAEVLDDTWVYDVSDNTWTPWIALTPSSPPSARYGANMVYDPESGSLLLLRTTANASFQRDFNDTWAFSLPTATWTNLNPSGTIPAPGDEGRVSMTYNEASGNMLLLAGLPPIPRVVTTGDQYKDWSGWSYETSSNSWAENPRAPESPPISRYYSLDFDRVSFKIVLFGGVDPQGETQDDTWISDPVANTWSMVLAGAPDGPPGRVNHAVVYNAGTGSMIMFGGRSAEGKNADVPNETWEYRP
jgi:N-acetylneuraminic acid mutarotase